MAIMTTTEQLEEVQAAITETLKSLELGTGDDKVVRSRLDHLTARESVLLARYKTEQAAGTSGGFVNKAEFGSVQ